METIGGYRLVRRLGSGDRAEVWLGHAGSALENAEIPTVAIKIFRPAVNSGSISTEIEAVTRTSSRHLIQLEDLATMGDGRPALIFARLGSTTAADLITDRRIISPGEAVTLVAPIAAAVSALHQVGVAHGKVGLGSIRFDASGAPVLCCFGASQLIGSFSPDDDKPSLTPLALAARQEAKNDVAALVSLARVALEATPESPARQEILRTLDDELVDLSADRLCLELANRLFDFAAAEPLRFVFGEPTNRVDQLSRPNLDASQVPPRRVRRVRRGKRPAVTQRGTPRNQLTGNETERFRTGRFGEICRGLGLNRWTREGVALLHGGIRALRGLMPEWIVESSSRALAERSGSVRQRVSRSHRQSAKLSSEAKGHLAPRMRRLAVLTVVGCSVLLTAGLALVPESDAPGGSRTAVQAETRPERSPNPNLSIPGEANLKTVTRPENQVATRDDPGRRSGANSSVNSSDDPTPGPRANSRADSILGLGANPNSSPNSNPSSDRGANPNSLTAINGQDPLAAARALLDQRQECFRKKSMICLEKVVQPGSAAADSDRYRLRQLTEGTATSVENNHGPVSPILVERLGDSALLNVHLIGGEGASPAALLLIRTSAGWRIRDLVIVG